MKSYESSNWFIKTWRKRWYIYAIFLHIKNLLNIYILIDLLLYKKIDNSTREKLRKEWKYIIKHIELSKMYKYS
jgi:hypothetical protein